MEAAEAPINRLASRKASRASEACRCLFLPSPVLTALTRKEEMNCSQHVDKELQGAVTPRWQIGEQQVWEGEQGLTSEAQKIRPLTIPEGEISIITTPPFRAVPRVDTLSAQ